MASKRTTDNDTFDLQSEEGFPLNPSSDDLAQVAAIALEAEAEADRLHQQMHQQQQQIEQLFRLVNKQRGNGNGKNNGRPDDSPAVQLFKKRTQVLKRAYPNTRV